MFKNNLVVDNPAIEPASHSPSVAPEIPAEAPTDQGRADVAAHESRAMRIAFVGLDQTAKAVASKLLDAGHAVTVYDPESAAEPVTSTRWSPANTIFDACGSADAIFTMLPDEAIAEAAILGQGGVVECMPHDAIHVCSSIISVECCDRIVEAHWDAGQQYISAPVLVRSGYSPGGELLVIACGAEATIERMDPVLRAIGQVARLRGWPSDANVVRLAADCEREELVQYLSGHHGFCSRQLGSGWRSKRHPLAHVLDLETGGVWQ